MSAPLPSNLKQVDPQDAWKPWAPSEQHPFDAKWAGHLFRRVAFGASPDEIRKAVRDGFETTLDNLFTGDPRAATRLELFDAAGEEVTRAEDADALRAWWIALMLQGGHPLREKMVLFWHNHFATSVTKVRSPLLMFRQNQVLRKHALGKFGPMLGEISRDPAMLIWLDSNQNVKAHPNENFAREVMELFTLGVGNYRETDIREAARAFTGWHVNADGDGFELNVAEHDEGTKTILTESGKWNGDDVLRILLAQPACAQFLAAKLYRFFVSESDPPKTLLEALALQLRRTNYDLGDVVQTIIRSRLFYSEHAYKKRIKSPVEYVLGAIRAAWPGPVVAWDLVTPLGVMGQPVFAPPNVKGWTGGKNWLTDATLLARHNFAERVVNSPSQGPPPALPPANIPAASSGLNATDSPVVPQPPPSTGASTSAGVPSPATDSMWYVRKMKAQSAAAIVRVLAEQFSPGRLPEPVRLKLEAFLGPPDTIVPEDRVREVIHAVMCLPEYQLC